MTATPHPGLRAKRWDPSLPESGAGSSWQGGQANKSEEWTTSTLTPRPEPVETPTPQPWYADSSLIIISTFLWAFCYF